MSLLIKGWDFRPTTWSILVADRPPNGDSRTSSKRRLSGGIGRPAAKSIEATTALCSTHRTALTQIEELPPSYVSRPGQMTGSSGLAGARGTMDPNFQLNGTWRHLLTRVVHDLDMQTSDINCFLNSSDQFEFIQFSGLAPHTEIAMDRTVGHRSAAVESVVLAAVEPAVFQAWEQKSWEDLERAGKIGVPPWPSPRLESDHAAL